MFIINLSAMKRKFFALVGIFLALTLEPVPAKTNLNQFDSSISNYVVIGAFSIKKNAVRFASRASKQVQPLSLSAKYELNANRNLYYVYVLTTPDHAQAIQEAQRLRRETEYADAWVYNGSFTKPTETNVDINPMTNQQIDDVKQNDNAVDQPTQRVEVTQENDVAMDTATQETPHTIKDATEARANVPDSGEEGKKFVFKIFKGVDNTPIEGDVDVLDTQRSRKLGTYKGNEVVNVSLPTESSKKLSFICDVFGYRKVQRELDLNGQMQDDITIDEDQSIVVPFELVRLQKGDIAVMYNVYFFKDAGIMRPESRYEVNSLLEMLKENPKYKIKIHGHTNGGAAGRILSMGPANNFFSLSGAKEGTGTAKKLSEERAKVIKQYLVAAGIDETRMQIKAWGGKHPIHDKHSNRAQENVRVEIEILEN
jgi:outer membrane protein OmpA-like peptidoglycan-associated protein